MCNICERGFAMCTFLCMLVGGICCVCFLCTGTRSAMHVYECAVNFASIYWMLMGPGESSFGINCGETS